MVFRLFSFVAILPSAVAQQGSARPLTIEEAVQRALDRYPSVKVSSAAVNAAAAGIRIARTAYLPKLDATAGINRATRNNVFGLLFPSQIIAPISGPVLGTNDLDTAWGVLNPRNELSPGMFPEVSWPADSNGESLVVPNTAVVTTTERTFVIRVRNRRAEWVNVRKGAAAGDSVEVMGSLAPGDMVVRRATDELREGTLLPAATAR
jgi:hypothetical protein